jgi:ferredoxin-thioredoxin reductase catalytic subunit
MPTDAEILECIDKLRVGAEAGRYSLNPNLEDLKIIVNGYLENEAKFGYPACPCRLATGNHEEDKDIICPCDYRDDDISEFGACYCSLYVNDEIASGKSEVEPIPERRVQKKTDIEDKRSTVEEISGGLKVNINIWRCPVCGYLCAKDQPPPKCPICGVSKDRFELFIKAG